MTQTLRQIESYCFTQADLDLIGTTNIGAAISFAVASLAGGFWLDVNKDAMFAEKLPPAAEAIQALVNAAVAPIGVVAAILGIYFVWKRGSVIDRVKRESKSVPIE